MLQKYSKVMHKIRVISITFLIILDETEIMIHEYFVPVQHHKCRPEWKYIIDILTNIQKVMVN